MADPEEIQEWLAKADEDKLVAEVLLKSGEELTLPCMFHLQQMLEKLLKALIISSGEPIERTHDLDRLAQIAGVEEIEGLFDLCDVLNLFAVNGRYPGDLPDVSILEARRYYEHADAVGVELLQRIKGYISG